jgi:uncharacterized membrane protein YkvA (DUF1232 family)
VPGWLTAILVLLAIYAIAVLALVLAGRRVAARELATLVPNLILLFKDLATDPRVPRVAKVWLVVGGVWLVSPIDLIPEFIPVLGPLDDAVVAALILRTVARRAGVEVITEHWRGDPATLGRLLRAARIS